MKLQTIRCLANVRRIDNVNRYLHSLGSVFYGTHTFEMLALILLADYDKLADRTVFLQDREPSCGFFMSSGELGDHLMMNVSLYDYLDPTNGALHPRQG